MKIKALITTLVLGSSSVAMAHPVATQIVRGQPTPVYQPAPVPQPAYHRAAWMTLGSVNQIANGAMAFRVGWNAEQFSTLKLQSQGGKTLVQRVLIQFANGRMQMVELNQYLT